MLKTRVITALLLLAVLVPILYLGSIQLFSIVATLFFGAAMWEGQRLFNKPAPLLMALVWSALFYYLSLNGFLLSSPTTPLLFALCVLFWLLRLIPSLAFGLPALNSISNSTLNGIYGLSIFGCFVAMTVLFAHSPLFFLSVMAVVWVADVGAYFSGKAFGRRKLAPSISPGKSWEGAIGGWLGVLLVGGLAVYLGVATDIFPAKIFIKLGVLGFVLVFTLLASASVVGDLFESSLKRRANMKDSSALLPGHGGVLDRIDALIPVLPLAALLDLWLR
ncbi:phosphatidate cytidylyltransferase [Undibacterium sp. Ren11W]|uniref:phosphatidate cytidylyltransferase n=1 Tax=Undibacterium sp. Ren11W TaxID=3413045 RepID=UPI003BF22CA9